MSTPTLIKFGDLIAPGEYRLHSTFRHTINYVLGMNLVTLAEESVGAGPHTILLNTLNGIEHDTLVIREDFAILGNTVIALDLNRLYDSTLPIPGVVNLPKLRENLAFFRDTLKEFGHPKSLTFLIDVQQKRISLGNFETLLRDRFLDSCQKIAKENYSEAVNQIKGIGYGATPSGDDFIAGLLISLNLRQMIFKEDQASVIDEIYTTAISDNIFTTSFLRTAKDGRVFEKLKLTVSALLTADSSEVIERTKGLLAVGETSGTDLGVGLLFGLSPIL